MSLKETKGGSDRRDMWHAQREEKCTQGFGGGT